MTAATKEDAELDQLVLTGRTLRITLSELLLACDALEPIEEVFNKFRPKQHRYNQVAHEFPLQEVPTLRRAKRRRADWDEYSPACSIEDSHMEPRRPNSCVSPLPDDMFSAIIDSSLSPLTDYFCLA